MKIGDPVIWIDAVRQEHAAILTNIFGEVRVVQQMQEGELVDVTIYPVVNVVFVSSDESKQDSYGRQLERATSAGHISANSAKAYCWKFPHE
jgi:hypothetical protein